MNTHADKSQENKSQSVAKGVSQKKSGGEATFQFVDNRPEALQMRERQEVMNNSPRVRQLKVIQKMADESNSVNQVAQLNTVNNDGSPIQFMLPRGISRLLSSGRPNALIPRPPNALIPWLPAQPPMELEQPAHPQIEQQPAQDEANNEVDAPPPMELEQPAQDEANNEVDAPQNTILEWMQDRLPDFGLGVLDGLGGLDNDPQQNDFEQIGLLTNLADDRGLEGEERVDFFRENGFG